ncbi:MAG: hypothetical protein B7Y90_18410 [Alphaproteobacteria bacterium 32-64-14]|nr:MAG: hypothetical protein B7Y90_18410 [Alphaproteobacteria bacterium 32-64-14]
MDARTNSISWSPGMYRIFGLDPACPPRLEDAMAQVHPQDQESSQAHLERNLNGEIAPSIARIIRPNGDVRHIEGRNACEFDADGHVLAIYGSVLDITERIETQAALAESERRYRQLAENSSDVTFCFLMDGTITFANPTVTDMFGYTPEEVAGRTVFDLMHADDHERVRGLFMEYVKRGPKAPPVKIEFRAVARDGRELTLESHPRTIFDQAGKVVEIQDVLRDVSAGKAIRQSLLAAKDAAEAASAIKGEFLANMSHELRTPLTAIVGYANLLRNTEAPPEARALVRKMEDASNALLSLVNSLLDFSRLEAGQFTARPRPAQPAEIALQCLDLVRATAEAKGLRVSHRVAEGVPLRVMIDPDAYRQTVLNLLGNAVKFTEAGSVSLEIAYDQEAAALRVAVADTGPGIAAPEMDKLFRRFSQLDGGLTRQHGGAGLGLAICKGLVEAMGGNIGVQSAPQQGARFVVTLPAPEVEPIEAAAGVALPLGGARVLVADDNAAIREIVHAMLSSCDAVVTEAANGSDALRMAMEQPFDLMLIDVRMPNLTGDAVVRSIRTSRGPNSATPIAAFTASGVGKQAGFYREAGFDLVLTKPVSASAIVGLIVKYHGTQAGDAA